MSKMPRNHMLLAVGQTLCFAAAGWIISHHLLNNAYDNASQHHLWKEFMNTIEMIENTTSANSALNETAFNAANNITVNNTSDGFNFTITDDHETFYWKTLPRDLLFTAVVAPLYYYWHIWLERSFPARPRPAMNFTRSEKDKLIDEDESMPQEEEVIQRWIAQGKIRRASLSWWNTFVKWTLNLVLGAMWMEILHSLLSHLLDLKLPKYSLSSMKWDLLFTLVGAFIGIRPLASLVGFIVMPANQRIVFEAGAEAVWDIFFSTFVGIFLPWLAETEFAKIFVNSMAEKAMEDRNKSMNAVPQLGHTPSLPDEL